MTQSQQVFTYMIKPSLIFMACSRSCIFVQLEGAQLNITANFVLMQLTKTQHDARKKDIPQF